MKKFFQWLAPPGQGEQLDDDEQGQLPPWNDAVEPKEQPTPPSSPLLYSSQERKMRVTLFVNGARSGGKVMLVRPEDTLAELLVNASKKLSLTTAKRVFTKDGGEIDDVEEINPDDVLYISLGEDFISPASTTTSLSSASSSSLSSSSSISSSSISSVVSAVPSSAPSASPLAPVPSPSAPELPRRPPPAQAASSTPLPSSLSSSSSSSTTSVSATFAASTRQAQVAGRSLGGLSPEEEDRYRKCLKTYFGYSSFRPLQVEVIQACLEGRDSFLCMATGAGKSLCYQLPALLTQKVVIVVSPLISLMVDQVLALQQANVKACFLGSAQRDATVERDACNGRFNLVYMAPEKIVNMRRQLQELVERQLLVLLAIDEAHCVSEWGHDFRAEYRDLGKVRGWIPSVPVMAVTGTATASVEADVIASLALRDPLVAKSSFARPNLFFSVALKSSDVAGDLKKLLFPPSSSTSSSSSSSSSSQPTWVSKRSNMLQESVIIYCCTIKETENIASLVQSMGVQAEVYHANLGPRVREEVHKKFVTDQTQVIVATVAFGMGIDKPDVRKIIHFGPPKSLEAYYQQAGRAGRDGLAASCHLLYAPGDLAGYRFMAGPESTRAERVKMGSAVAAYASTTSCRQQFILDYFGETAPPCGNCDNCLQPPSSRDFAEEALLFLSTISLTGGKFGLGMIVDILRGSKAVKLVERKFDRLATHGRGKQYSKEWWNALGRQLTREGYITEIFKEMYKTYSLSPKGQRWSTAGANAGEPLVLPIPAEMREEENSRERVKERQRQQAHQQQLRFMDRNVEDLFSHLIAINREEAHSRGLAPYMVIPINVLETLARVRPSTDARFRAIEGIDEHKASTYASIFIAAIQRFCQQRGMRTDVGAAEAKAGMVGVDAPLLAAEPRGQKRPLAAAAEGLEKMTQTKMEVYKLFAEQQLSVETISQVRNVKTCTVLSYLAAAIENGYPVEWERLGISDDVYRTVARVLDLMPPEKRTVLRAIKERVPDPAIDYGVVRIIQACYLAHQLHHLPPPAAASQPPPQPQPSQPSQQLKKPIGVDSDEEAILLMLDADAAAAAAVAAGNNSFNGADEGEEEEDNGGAMDLVPPFSQALSTQLPTQRPSTAAAAAAATAATSGASRPRVLPPRQTMTPPPLGSTRAAAPASGGGGGRGGAHRPAPTLARMASFPSPTVSSSTTSTVQAVHFPSAARALSFGAGPSSVPRAGVGVGQRPLLPYPPSFTATATAKTMTTAATTTTTAQARPPARGSKFVRHAGNKMCPSPSVSPVKPWQEEAGEEDEEAEEEKNDASQRQDGPLKRRRMAGGGGEGGLQAPPAGTQEPAVALTKDLQASQATTPPSGTLTEQDVLRRIRETEGGMSMMGLLRAFPASRAADIDAVLAGLQEAFLIYRGDDNHYRPL